MTIGRPPFEITQEVLDKAEAYASRGLTLQNISDCLGISYQTLNEKSKEYADFSDAIKRGKATGLAHVADKLLKNVDVGNVTAQIFFLKCNGWKETSVVETTGRDGAPVEVDIKHTNANDLMQDRINKLMAKPKDELNGD